LEKSQVSKLTKAINEGVKPFKNEVEELLSHGVRKEAPYLLNSLQLGTDLPEKESMKLGELFYED
jgi:hypothetical protein